MPSHLAKCTDTKPAVNYTCLLYFDKVGGINHSRFKTAIEGTESRSVRNEGCTNSKIDRIYEEVSLSSSGHNDADNPPPHDQMSDRQPPLSNNAKDTTQTMKKDTSYAIRMLEGSKSKLGIGYIF